MEISPIAGVRAMPVRKSPPTDPELTPLFDIENTGRTGDETWSPSSERTARGSEDAGLEDDGDELASEDEAEPVRRPDQGSASGQISFFA